MFRSFQAVRRSLAQSQPSRTIAYRTRVSLDRIMSDGLQPLSFASGPLVWIDCEMTGLDPRKDKILEIAVLITNGNLDLVDEGIEFVVHAEKAVLDRMDEWCTNQHASSGLTQECLKSQHTVEDVEQKVFDYIKKWIPQQRTGVLAGNSVHADRAFLVYEMPKITDHLHYRIVDVSSIKELCRRWYPTLEVPKDLYEKDTSAHRALSDIRGSIRELKWYRDNIFRASAELTTVPSRRPASPRGR
ncbi:ribonuclease H-like protein [Daedalea quercina L-15889]|uniref:Ribonuclease H-like protein n=1 Tax=Daedalea quercina L-15889 TaxID=1314783 RepID=A0A165SQ75_9APHY|nr:ribonuclease H-like protein [Daedalea quercina L-15889]